MNHEKRIIRFKNSVLRSISCGYSDTYILVRPYYALQRKVSQIMSPIKGQHVKIIRHFLTA